MQNYKDRNPCTTWNKQPQPYISFHVSNVPYGPGWRGPHASDKKFLKFLSSYIAYYFTSYQSLVLKRANAHIAHAGKQCLKLRWFWLFGICTDTRWTWASCFPPPVGHVSLWSVNKGMTRIPAVRGLSSVLATIIAICGPSTIKLPFKPVSLRYYYSFYSIIFIFN